MTKTPIHTDNAPPAVGPYSQAIVANGMVYCSGQGGIDPKTRKVVEGGVQAQTTQVLTNLRAVLEAAGSSLDKVVKTTVFLKSMSDFAAMNEIYATFFPGTPPARSTVEATAPVAGMLVEIEVIALV